MQVVRRRIEPRRRLPIALIARRRAKRAKICRRDKTRQRDLLFACLFLPNPARISQTAMFYAVRVSAADAFWRKSLPATGHPVKIRNEAT